MPLRCIPTSVSVGVEVISFLSPLSSCVCLSVAPLCGALFQPQRRQAKKPPTNAHRRDNDKTTGNKQRQHTNTKPTQHRPTRPTPTMSDGLTQRRPTSSSSRVGASSSVAAASKAVGSQSIFSSNPSKARGEKFFLGWAVVWVSIMAIIVATRMFEVSRTDERVLQGRWRSVRWVPRDLPCLTCRRHWAVLMLYYAVCLFPSPGFHCEQLHGRRSNHLSSSNHSSFPLSGFGSFDSMATTLYDESKCMDLHPIVDGELLLDTLLLSCTRNELHLPSVEIE